MTETMISVSLELLGWDCYHAHIKLNNQDPQLDHMPHQSNPGCSFLGRVINY